MSVVYDSENVCAGNGRRRFVIRAGLAAGSRRTLGILIPATIKCTHLTAISQMDGHGRNIFTDCWAKATSGPK